MKHIRLPFSTNVRTAAVFAVVCFVAIGAAVHHAQADEVHFTVALQDPSLTASQHVAAAYTVVVTPANDFGGVVTLTVQNCPAASTCVLAGNGTLDFSANHVAAQFITLTITNSVTGTTPADTYSFTVVGTSGTATSQSAGTLQVTGETNFSMTISPSTLTLNESTSSTLRATIHRQGGFNGTVTVTPTAVPGQGKEVTLSPSSYTLAGSDTIATFSAKAGPGSAGRTYAYNINALGGGYSATQNGYQVVVNASVACTTTPCSSGQTCTVTGCQTDPVANSQCNSSSCYDEDSSFHAPAANGCWASWSRCQTSSVLKVRKDRQCDQWLDCKSSVTLPDPTNLSRLTPQCSSLGVCIQLGSDGSCSRFLEEPTTSLNRSFTTPDQVKSGSSLISMYSGYSSGFHFTDQNTITATYPTTNIKELGLEGASTVDLVQNGSFEELNCLGGPRDRKACIVPADCRVGQAVCAQNQEPLSPGITTNTPCQTHSDCSDVKSSNGTATRYCRYLTAWTADISCRNPQDSQWFGMVNTSDSGVDTAGYGLRPGDATYDDDVRWGRRRSTTGDESVRWRVWEDEENFFNQSGVAGRPSTGYIDPRYPDYAQEKHLKDGNNVMKVTVDQGAKQFSGVGVPISQQLAADGSYIVSFKYKVASGVLTPLPIKVQLGLNYASDASASAGGYKTTSTTSYLAFGDVKAKTVCSLDPNTSCTVSSNCNGAGSCVDTGDWQTFTLGPFSIPSSYTSALTPILSFVTDQDATNNGTTFYLDDVSLKPALNIANQDKDATKKVNIRRTCRLFPRDDAPDCEYTDDAGAHFRGWRGYCLDRDPNNADLCLTWWPLDVLSGESGLGGSIQGYSGPAPVYQCLEQEGGTSLIDIAASHVGDVDNEYHNSVDVSSYKLHWKDIERLDVFFDADDETESGTRDWSDDLADGYAGVTSHAQDGSRFWITSDMQVNRKFSTDEGLRLYIAKRQAQDNGGLNDHKAAEDSSWSDVYNDKCHDDDTKINNNDDQYMAVRVHFQKVNDAPGPTSGPNDKDAIVDKIDYKLCDDADNTVEGDQRWRFLIRAKQACTYVVQTVSQNNTAAVEKAWAERVKPTSTYKIPDLGYGYNTDAAPYGAMAPFSTGSPTGWIWSPGSGVDSSGSVVESNSSGSNARAGTPYSLLDQVPEGSQPRYCFNPSGPTTDGFDLNNPGVNQPSLNSTNQCASRANISSCQASATGSECVGQPGKHCSGNPLWACSTDNDCSGQGLGFGTCNGTADAGKSLGIDRSKALDRLKHIFAQGFGCWKLNAQLVQSNGTACGSNPTNCHMKTSYVSGCGSDISGLTGGQTWDVVTDGTQCPSSGRPAYDPANTSKDYCYVLPAINNVTIGGVTSGTVNVAPGKSATLAFQYSVDAQQLPAKQYKINWDGSSCTTGASNEVPNTTQIQESMTFEPSDLGRKFTPRICIVDNWLEGQWSKVVGQPGQLSPVSICVNDGHHPCP